MTDEEHFDRVIRERIADAQQATGHSFSRLKRLVDEIGAVEAARRLTSPGSIGRFPYGMRMLLQFGRLDLSIEQAVIEFGERRKIFTAAEVERAKDRLQMLRILYGTKN